MTVLRVVFALTLTAVAAGAQTSGKASYEAFAAWRKAAAVDDWDTAIARYRAKLKTDGLDTRAIENALRAIETYDEGVWYDKIYTAAPSFNTEPNRLLTEAVKGRTPGAALDVAMGQGRNSVFLASQGWTVTGFDVAAAGLKAAEQRARARGLAIETVHSSDEDFEFGESRWDLIANLYAMEKRSVQRARTALKPGGLVVVEAGHRSASGAPFEYDSNELLRIFDGFRILKYEETIDVADWSGKPIRLVRLIAEKPLPAPERKP
jgi:2-polyprenyl-3-methyl-5-hydroxy-6-metoxy-1,4-benzoquinol methylase